MNKKEKQIRSCPCGRVFDVRPDRLETHRYCSQGCYHKHKDVSLISGRLSEWWKGDDIKYRAIHNWLHKKFGKATLCENKQCPQLSNSYDWALRRGFPYKRRRSNFIQLCRSCHVFYDKMGDGVYYCKPRGVWVAQMKVGGKTKYLGSATAREGALLIRKNAIKNHYEFCL